MSFFSRHRRVVILFFLLKSAVLLLLAIWYFWAWKERSGGGGDAVSSYEWFDSSSSLPSYTDFPEYHPALTTATSSGTYTPDAQGNQTLVPFSASPPGFTYYLPGSIRYSPSNYVPTYKESVVLSSAGRRPPDS